MHLSNFAINQKNKLSPIKTPTGKNMAENQLQQQTEKALEECMIAHEFDW